MGDAYTAHDIGYEAVYYNPAGVARPGKPQLKIVDLEMTMSQGMLSLLGKSFSSLASMSQIINNLTQNPDSNQAVGLSLLPQFLVKNFSVGLIARTYAEAYLTSAGGDLNFFGTADFAGYVSTGAALLGGRLKIGASLKALDRAEVNKVYTPAEYSGGLTLATQFQEGIGYGLDLGVLATWPILWLPTLGVSLLDVGDTDLIDRRIFFTGSGGTPGAPAAIPQRLNVGLTLNPKHDRGIKSTIAFELKDVLHVRTLSDSQSHFHLGYELNVQDLFFFRAGLNQGHYWTAGIGIQGRSASLEFSTYGEDISFVSTTRVDDRKFVMRYVLGF